MKLFWEAYSRVFKIYLKFGVIKIVKKGAEELVRQKIHPNSVIAGYTLACKESVKYIRENLTIPVADINRESVVNAAKVINCWFL